MTLSKHGVFRRRIWTHGMDTIDSCLSTYFCSDTISSPTGGMPAHIFRMSTFIHDYQLDCLTIHHRQVKWKLIFCQTQILCKNCESIQGAQISYCCIARWTAPIYKLYLSWIRKKVIKEVQRNVFCKHFLEVLTIKWKHMIQLVIFGLYVATQRRCSWSTPRRVLSF